MSLSSLLQHLLRRSPNHLADNVVLILRHSEKPASGNGLSSPGQARANAFAPYFAPFCDTPPGMEPFTPTALYAGADSRRSARPRLTLEPLARSLKLPVNATIGTSSSASLVHRLRSTPHGLYPLVSWRHKQLPTLIRAFGADPGALLPGGKWPIDIYHWIILLTFDHAGHLASQHRLRQAIELPLASPAETQ